ncbi:Maff2 family mobile element protein [Priestia megaterium]|uniref:Maff2 family mobile element protein n=1 Tax=Priestia megaterium TaxID=1404 RepID=UPI001A951307|nr:Maff2 family protein [Priestia megaterium]QSX24464.1 Maff2 family protein [Priestia megaterium]
MNFFTTGVDVMQKLVILIGAGLGGWGVINLLEGYGNDNPGAKSQGMKQFMSGAGIVLVAMLLIPQLKSLFH